MVSKTKSLEKNPLSLGIPNKFRRETLIKNTEKGVMWKPLER